MDDKKHPADVLADRLEDSDFSWTQLSEACAVLLRCIPGLEAERDNVRSINARISEEMGQLRAERDSANELVARLQEQVRNALTLAAPQAAQPAGALGDLLRRLRVQVAWYTGIGRDDTRKVMADALAALEALKAQAAQPESPCILGCRDECRAQVHGCASDCPALPWQPAPQAAQPLLCDRCRCTLAQDDDKGLSRWFASRPVEPKP